MPHQKTSRKPQLSKINQSISENPENNWECLLKSLQEVPGTHAVKNQCILLGADSRTVLAHLPNESVACFITSPPYASLKDYGTPGQIGFGQDPHTEFLPDMRKVLAELYRIALPGASLWLVLDMIKKSGEAIPLPWDIVTLAREAGWTLHDTIIWDKGKSLPWSGAGRFRAVCEHIFLLGKGKLSTFNLDAVRDSTHLSSYWIKYPERYHPDGKAPTDLWHFPIPNQGTWAKGQSRHYCPFPVGLIERMISVSTHCGDIVVDPFSGTGSVIATASHLKRHGVGIELNPVFVHEFDKTGFTTLVERAEQEFPSTNPRSISLRKTIIELRMLKYAKTLFAGIARNDVLGNQAKDGICAFLLTSTQKTTERETDALDSGNLGCINLQVLLRRDTDYETVSSAIESKLRVEPLSIFGIKAHVEVISFDSWEDGSNLPNSPTSDWYAYRNGKFFRYSEIVESTNLLETFHLEAAKNPSCKVPSIFSTLGLSLDDAISD